MFNFRENKSNLARCLLASVLMLSIMPPAMAVPKQNKGKISNKKAVATKKESKKTVTAKKETAEKIFANLRSTYRKGSITGKDMWLGLTNLNERGDLARETKAKILLAQSHILLRDEYPILAGIYAAQALTLTETPLSQEMQRGWQILWESSEKSPIQNVLEITAENLEQKNLPDPPYFGANWQYIQGKVAEKKNDKLAALKKFQSLSPDDRYFPNAKFQSAMISLEANQTDKAIEDLKAIIHPANRKMFKHPSSVKNEVFNNARLAIARILYERKEFEASIQYFRSVSKDSDLYYDALSEQSWAFFLAGYPNHALGAIHGAQSPFYKEVFNPEMDVLKSIIFYWICDYDASRTVLARFIDDHKNAVSSLSDFLSKRHLTAETAYTLFEDMISGVSDQSLGIPKNVLNTAATKSSMLKIRDQYASFIEEQNRLQAKGVYGEKIGTENALSYIDRLITSIKKDLGIQFIAEFKAMKDSYDELYNQSEFLYVELLMSQKEKVLGKELHASSKITEATSSVDQVKGWGKDTRSWDQSAYNEYWWDEVGYYVYQTKPECNTLQ